MKWLQDNLDFFIMLHICTLSRGTKNGNWIAVRIKQKDIKSTGNKKNWNDKTLAAKENIWKY